MTLQSHHAVPDNILDSSMNKLQQPVEDLRKLCPTCSVLDICSFVQSEAEFRSLAERLRDGEGRAADTDRAARDALQRCVHAEAQLQSTEVSTMNSHQPAPV